MLRKRKILTVLSRQGRDSVDWDVVIGDVPAHVIDDITFEVLTLNMRHGYEKFRLVWSEK